MNRLSQRILIVIYMAVITPVVMVILAAFHICVRLWEARAFVFLVWDDIKDDWDILFSLWSIAWVKKCR